MVAWAITGILCLFLGYIPIRVAGALFLNPLAAPLRECAPDKARSEREIRRAKAGNDISKGPRALSRLEVVSGLDHGDVGSERGSGCGEVSSWLVGHVWSEHFAQDLRGDVGLRRIADTFVNGGGIDGDRQERAGRNRMRGWEYSTFERRGRQGCDAPAVTIGCGGHTVLGC